MLDAISEDIGILNISFLGLINIISLIISMIINGSLIYMYNMDVNIINDLSIHIIIIICIIVPFLSWIACYAFISMIFLTWFLLTMVYYYRTDVYKKK